MSDETDVQLSFKFMQKQISVIGNHLIYKPILNDLFESKILKSKILYGHFDPNTKHYTSLTPQSQNSLQFKPITNLFDFS